MTSPRALDARTGPGPSLASFDLNLLVAFEALWVERSVTAAGRRLHSFRFFGLAFLLPGFVGPALPAAFAVPTAYGDFVTALLAMLVLLTARERVLLPLAWVFNVFGAADLIMATVQAIRVDLPSVAGQLGAAYAIPVLYVPLLLITHGVAFSLLLRPAYTPARSAG